MHCPECGQESVSFTPFCLRCNVYSPDPAVGQKAGVVRRFVASLLDVGLGFSVWFGGSALAAAIAPDLGIAALMVIPLAYLGWVVTLLRRGMTPAKLVLGLQVMDRQSGATPGLGRMFIRETVGKFASGLFLGLGYLWALWDAETQAWHDKIASTVVVRRRAEATPFAASGPAGVAT